MKYKLARFIRNLADLVESFPDPLDRREATDEAFPGPDSKPREGFCEFDSRRPFRIGYSVQYDGVCGDNQGYRWYGFSIPRPQLGDVILARMKGGEIGRFLITFVQLPDDPPDQWFAETRVRLEDGIEL